ncbi:MAG TPA: formyltransferase family protein [Gemmatimonadales bacterium]
MRIAFLTNGGTFGLQALEALAEDHEIVAVVRPVSTASLARRLLGRAARATGLRPKDPVAMWTRRAPITVLRAQRGSDERMMTALAQIKPDVACIATFPWLLDPGLLTIPRYGTVNLHPSLLPRHRGANPYFWTYYHDDRETGVTVHEAGERADAGALLDQERFALHRGTPIDALYSEMGRRGATLLRRTVAAIERGVVQRQPQDERLATRAPRVNPGTPMVRFTEWDVERVWHFLGGLASRFREPLADARGRTIHYRRVVGYSESRHQERPGSIARVSSGWNLACRGGYVCLA